MKILIFFVLLIIPLDMLGQTDSIEKAILYNKLITNQIDQSEFSSLWRQWNEKNKSDKYPDQPMDKNGQVHFIFINEFKGFDSEYLINRTLEWMSINYGLIPSAVYTNLKDGRVIFRVGLTLFDNYSCVPTTIISIKDEKIRLEFISISYQVYSEGDYYSGIPESTKNLKVYPVILKKPYEWTLNLSLLKETNKLFKSEVQNLTDYILNYGHSTVF